LARPIDVVAQSLNNHYATISTYSQYSIPERKFTTLDYHVSYIEFFKFLGELRQQIWYGFLLVFYGNSVPKTRGHVFEVFDFKNMMTLKTGLGVSQRNWKYHHSVESVRLPIDVRTMALSRVVSDIFSSSEPTSGIRHLLFPINVP